MSPPAGFFACLVAMEALHLVMPGPRWLDAPWTLLGLAPVVAGALLHARASRAFRRRGTTLDPAGRPRTLVREGPFAHTRNPMYLAGVPILAGVAILLGTLGPLLVLPAYAAAAGRWVAREERALLVAFGAEWEGYRAEVRRWL